MAQTNHILYYCWISISFKSLSQDNAICITFNKFTMHFLFDAFTEGVYREEIKNQTGFDIYDAGIGAYGVSLSCLISFFTFTKADYIS